MAILVDIALKNDWFLATYAAGFVGMVAFIEWTVRSIYPLRSLRSDPPDGMGILSGVARGQPTVAPLSGESCIGWSILTKLPVQRRGRAYAGEEPGVASPLVLELVNGETGLPHRVDLRQMSYVSGSKKFGFGAADAPEHECRLRDVLAISVAGHAQ
ncbi:MAG: hypothetical protein JKY37_17885 [Nannocystaceae bacterium]|nr:hypothetical protein [Nannocystaceae bacterium]